MGVIEIIGMKKKRERVISGSIMGIIHNNKLQGI
jgi:hypothetical protein